MSAQHESIEHRLRRIEVRNRLLSATIGGLLLILVIGMNASPTNVRTSSVQLVDPNGAVRAELILEDGQPRFVLKDSSGVDRLKLFHGEDGTGLYIADEGGTTRVGIAQFAHGGGGVALHGPESKGAAVLYFKNEGSLRFFDAEGKVTNMIAASKPKPEP
jgi:hypothetical protein